MSKRTQHVSPSAQTPTDRPDGAAAEPSADTVPVTIVIIYLISKNGKVTLDRGNVLVYPPGVDVVTDAPPDTDSLLDRLADGSQLYTVVHETRLCRTYAERMLTVPMLYYRCPDEQCTFTNAQGFSVPTVVPAWGPDGDSDVLTGVRQSGCIYIGPDWYHQMHAREHGISVVGGSLHSVCIMIIDRPS